MARQRKYRLLESTAYYDEKQQPMSGPDGYHMVIYRYTNGALTETYFHDTNLKLTNCNDGYARIVYRNDKNG